MSSHANITQGPVVITDRGRPAFALLKIEDYYALTGRQEVSLLELMDSIPGGVGIDFDAPRARIDLPVTDFS